MRDKQLLSAKGGILIYSVASLVVFLVVFWELIVSRLRESSEFAASIFSEDTAKVLDKTLQNDYLGKISVGIFWASIAATGLLLVWIMINAYIQAKNNMTSATQFERLRLTSYLKRPALQLGFGAILVTFIVFVSKVGFSAWYKFGHLGVIASPFGFGSGVRIIVAIAVAAICFYIFHTLFKLMKLSN